MSKTKNKNHSENRYYQGIIRELKKQVRQLQKQLKYYDKRQHILEDNELEIQELKDKKEEIPEIKKKIKCQDCNSGYYDEFMLLNRLYGTCNSCGARKRLV